MYARDEHTNRPRGYKEAHLPNSKLRTKQKREGVLGHAFSLLVDKE